MKKKFGKMLITFVICFPWSIVVVPIAAAANSCSQHQEVSQ